MDTGTKGSISHGETLSCLSLAADSSHSTFTDLHRESAQSLGSATPTPVIVPVHLPASKIKRMLIPLHIVHWMTKLYNNCSQGCPQVSRYKLFGNYMTKFQFSSKTRIDVITIWKLFLIIIFSNFGHSVIMSTTSKLS